MKIVELDANDATQVEELFTLQQEVHAADCPDNPVPLREDFLGSVRNPPPDGRFERLVAWRDGRLAGALTLVLPEVDNRHLALAEIQVSPSHRRRGIGRTLLERACRLARENGRRDLLAAAIGPVPGGAARNGAAAGFVTAAGFSVALESVRRRIDLTAVDAAAEQRLLDQCLSHAIEYESLGWTGLTPDDLAGGVANLVNRLNLDAPTGELDIEPETIDADRLHTHERNAIERHTQLVGTAARHRNTGEVAAITLLNVRSAGDHGSVTLTIADPKHRGHRLGMIVKIEIHRLVRRAFPRLRYIQTGNATANAHMNAINEQLGFAAYETNTLYQLAL
jgi:GNAT superfamily N-acetyltransferase